MPGPERPGDLPPGIPSEYAEAYRRGYERAVAESVAGQADPPDHTPPGADDAEQTVRLGPFGSLDGAFVHDVEPDTPAAYASSGGERRRLLAPALLAGLALLLVLSAYGMGRVLSGGASDVGASEGGPTDLVTGAGGDRSGKERPRRRERYDGRLTAAAVGGAEASCQSGSSVDAAGNPVSYDPEHVFDGDLTTAWRCHGRGKGERVVLRLDGETTVGQVGMVPGYAKTDARSGVDRYAQNNRVTKVRWHFDDGSSVVQRLDGSPWNRSMQTVRVPETTTDRVVVEILRSTTGPRNTVAISEVRIGAVAD